MFDGVGIPGVIMLIVVLIALVWLFRFVMKKLR